MTGWADLDAELGLWSRAGRTATLWWRDDDAVEETPQLERLIGLSDRHGVPLGLAVVPKPATDALARRIARSKATFTLQHGWRHRNHAPPGAKAAELGAHRPLEEMLAEAAEGLARLAEFPRFVPVLVPPWNRADHALIPGLVGLGFRGLSGYGPRDKEPVRGFTLINTHADIIAWKRGRGFAGEEKVLLELNGHLSARRDGSADAGEPTGLLTHHLVHDAACWDFLDTLFEHLARSPCVRWLDPREAFAIAEPAGGGSP